MDNNAVDLYRKHRPTEWADVEGQKDVVFSLQKHVANNTLPRVLMFVGPSGTGKTTLARIIAAKTGCAVDFPGNCIEINCADVRGIDSVRSISDMLAIRPMTGKLRVWILDEVMQLPKITQNAFLKVLEDVPSHARFILCTTTTDTLQKTLLTRCSIYNLKSLHPHEIKAVLARTLAKENRTLAAEVIQLISAKSDGSARQALQVLGKVLTAKTTERQMRIADLGSTEEEANVEFLARALMDRASWSRISTVLRTVENNQAEGLRRQIIDYCGAVLAGPNTPDNKRKLAYFVIRVLDNWRNCQRAELAAACWEACLDKPK